jgi:phosphoglycerol transferase
MLNDKVVILQPNKPATSYIYKNKQLHASSDDSQLIKQARALANYGNMAYSNNWYQ